MTADDLVYVTEHFPPHNYMEDSQLKGMSVDILEMIWKEMGAAHTREQVRIMPWARAIKLLETSPDMVLFGMGYSEERAKKFHWIGPYFVHELSLISRADDPVSMRHLDDARGLTIGVVRMDLGHQFLKEKLFDPAGLEPCDDIAQLHRKFMHGRFRLIFYAAHAYFNYAENLGLRRKAFQKAFTLPGTQSGYGFSRRIPAALVDKFQSALDRLKANGSVDRVLKRYRME